MRDVWVNFLLVFTLFSIGILSYLYIDGKFPHISIPIPIYSLLFTVFGFIIITAIFVFLIKRLAKI